MNSNIKTALFSLVLNCLLIFAAYGQTTAFTYQGKLSDGANASPTGTYDLQFTLYDANGAAVGGVTLVKEDVSVVNSVFTVSLDFAAAPFASNAARTLEIAVRAGNSTGAFTVLAPRQAITSAPYAIQALNASNVEMTTAGNSVVNSINNAATGATINSNRLSSDVVRLKPSASQTSTTTDAVNAPMLDLTGTVSNSGGVTTAASRFRLNHDGSFSIFKDPNASLNPLVKLNADGGFLVVGAFDGDSSGAAIPAEGAGTRMMWYPNKAAFRAGSVNGTQWDAANIGVYSTAFGDGARASGNWGFAVGQDTVAANSYSVALGHYNIASGFASVALGEFAHTNARQGSFVFADRSYTGGPCDTSNLGTYGTGGAGCVASGGVDTRVAAPWINSFTVRASGGFHFYTNPIRTTGLRLSSLDSGSLGGNLYGSFVWTDRSSDASVTPGSPNQTIFRSSGGYTIYSNSNLSSGVTLSAGGGSWTSVSDRNAKENFGAVNSRDVLRKVLQLPISTWSYKGQTYRHIGAMAQDFYQAFGVGENDKTITTVDPDGVAFAAIQGLNAELNERAAKLEAENKRLRAKLQTQDKQIADQQAQMNEFAARLKRLEETNKKTRRIVTRRK